MGTDLKPMRVALAQVAPVLLDRERTLAKVVAAIEEAAAAGARLVAFGEALVPGYPAWLERTDGARFDSPAQKQLFARYAEAAVCLEDGDLDAVLAAAARGSLAVVLGVIERPRERGKSLYASRVFVTPAGTVGSVHRKLQPTYEERLVWSPGDGAGLVTHRLDDFTVGALNCWENWMPLARTALYAAGEDLHVALWPGGAHNTRDLTRFLAREGRSFVLSVSGLLREQDVPADFPLRERFVPEPGATLLDGGSCIAGPDGHWLVEPVVGREELLVCDLDPVRVLEERQNFDAVGHYARPDVLRLVVDRRRAASVEWIDDTTPLEPS